MRHPEREDRSGLRKLVAVYAVELAVGTGLTILLFMLLLWLLNVTFPDSTGLGEFVRAPGASGHGDSRLSIDGREEPAIATLLEIRRDVRHRPANSVMWSAAAPGEPLGDRHAVQSQAGSGATIRFDERNSLELGEKSLVVVGQPKRLRALGPQRASVLFMNGFLRGRLGGGEGDLDVELTAGAGTVRPHAGSEQETEIALAMDNGNSALSVLQGQADVVWGDQVKQIPAGYMVTFDADQAPQDLVPLPDPPVPLSPRGGQTFVYRSTPPRVPFSWRPVGDAEQARLEISADPDFETRIYDGQRGDARFVHGNLQAGDYYWRVSGYRAGLTSAPSQARTLHIRQDLEPPALDVELPRGPATSSTVMLRGVTEPGCRVLVRREEVTTDARGRFEHELSLRNGYNFVVVQAVDPAGNTTFLNQTVVAELADPEGTP